MNDTLILELARNILRHTAYGEIILRLQQGETLIERRMRAGEAFHIAPRTVHQFEAVVSSDLLEASTPEIDDVVRLKDRYGRVP